MSLNGVWRLLLCLILIFVALWLASGGTEQAEIDSIGGEVTGPARNFAGQMAAQVEAESLRAETRRAAADRTLQAQQRQEAREVRNGRDRRRAGDDGRGAATGRAKS